MTNSTPSIPSGPRIREVVAAKFPSRNFLLGATIGTNDFDSVASPILDREYNYVTPENDFKHATVRRNPSNWDWSLPDMWVERIERNDQVLRMHCPIDRQHAYWTETADVAQLEPELEEWYKRICIRYGSHPRIGWMDVCNELVLYDGTWRDETDALPNPFFKLGREGNSLAMPSFVKRAVEICREHAPNLKLIWNQDGDITCDAQWDTIKDSVEYLSSVGCPIDGIGWQAHVGQHDLDYITYVNSSEVSDKLQALISWCHSSGLEFHVTENEFYLPSSGSIPSEEDLEAQAIAYAALVKDLIKGSKTGPVYMNMWSGTDDTSWIGDRHPSLFFADGRAKPAYYAVQRVLLTYSG